MAKKKPDKRVVYVTVISGDPQPVPFNDESGVHPALKDHLGFWLLKVSNRMRTMLDEALDPLQFQSVHFGILSILGEGEAISQNRVSEQLGVDKASMVKLVDHLESLKLVKRTGHTKDRRVRLLTVTPAGKTIFAQARKLATKIENDLLKNLTPEERDLVRGILPRILG